MKRVTDIISEFISAKGIEDVFMVSGGGLLFLTDGLYKNEKLNKVCCHHEQAAAMAAVGYAKYKGIGCAYITTGCGGTNAMTGLLNAYQDNTPCIFISGQVKRKESTRYRNLDIRQLGVQEADIVSIVEHITKYAVMLTEAEDVYYELEKAYHTAISGRPGPVWIDVPMDVQGAVVDETKLRHFVPEDKIKICATEEEISILKSAFEHAKRPIIVAGQGVRLSKAIDEFQKFVERYEIPFVASRLGTDVLPTENPLFIGRIGNKGTRAGNFAVQNADFVLALGSRLSVSSTGHEYEYFAREAKIFAVDIDTKEHKKGTVRIDKEINCDIKEFLKNFDIKEDIKYSEWAKICLNWKNKYPVALEEYKKEERVNLFTFINELSGCLKEDSVVVSDAGSAVYVTAQGIKTTTKAQRYVTSGGQAEMGFTLPAVIGVCFAKNQTEAIGITGDGSLQMNIQELQTLKHYNIPVKLFVWNNDGYLSIRSSQDKLFEGRKIGTDSTNGVSFPDLEKISYAYGLKYIRINNPHELKEKITEVLSYNEPVICEVMCIRDQPIVPMVSSKRLPDGRMVSTPIEDMYPFLDRKEFLQNMIVKPVEEE